jgi:hypothetical protein
LYDVAAAGVLPAQKASDAFDRGANALAARLPLYETGWNWSRYDLYPHSIVHVTSPFYHRLHIEQLHAMHKLAPREVFVATARRWELGARHPLGRAHALARKVAFRLLNPRKKVS